MARPLQGDTPALRVIYRRAGCRRQLVFTGGQRVPVGHPRKPHDATIVQVREPADYRCVLLCLGGQCTYTRKWATHTNIHPPLRIDLDHASRAAWQLSRRRWPARDDALPRETGRYRSARVPHPRRGQVCPAHMVKVSAHGRGPRAEQEGGRALRGVSCPDYIYAGLFEAHAS